MHELEFGRNSLPFRPTNDNNVLSDAVILSAIRTALRRGVARYDLTKWVRNHRDYLINMYTFEEKLVEAFGLDYIWTVLLAYMLACETAVTDTANFYSPYLPYALVDAPEGIAVDDLFVLHTATYAHALLYPIDPQRRRKLSLGTLTDKLMLYAIARLSQTYTVTEHPTPSLLTDRMFVDAVLEAHTNSKRWTLNVMSVSTGFVVVPAPHRPSTKKRRKKK